jgi:hypothetical protein
MRKPVIRYPLVAAISGDTNVTKILSANEMPGGGLPVFQGFPKLQVEGTSK